MFFVLKINFFNLKGIIKNDLVPAFPRAQISFHYRTMFSYNKISQPVLFNYNLKNNFNQRRKKTLKLTSERGVFAPYHKLKQMPENILSDEKEYFSNDRSCFLVPNFFYNLSIYTGLEYRSISSGSFKVMPTIQRGFDYFTNHSRKEDVFCYQDPIFQFKKNKLGEYVFTKRTGSMIHIVKKKKIKWDIL